MIARKRFARDFNTVDLDHEAPIALLAQYIDSMTSGPRTVFLHGYVFAAMVVYAWRAAQLSGWCGAALTLS